MTPEKRLRLASAKRAVFLIPSRYARGRRLCRKVRAKMTLDGALALKSRYARAHALRAHAPCPVLSGFVRFFRLILATSSSSRSRRTKLPGRKPLARNVRARRDPGKASKFTTDQTVEEKSEISGTVFVVVEVIESRAFGDRGRLRGTRALGCEQ